MIHSKLSFYSTYFNLLSCQITFFWWEKEKNQAVTSMPSNLSHGISCPLSTTYSLFFSHSMVCNCTNPTIIHRVIKAPFLAIVSSFSHSLSFFLHSIIIVHNTQNCHHHLTLSYITFTVKMLQQIYTPEESANAATHFWIWMVTAIFAIAFNSLCS